MHLHFSFKSRSNPSSTISNTLVFCLNFVPFLINFSDPIPTNPPAPTYGDVPVTCPNGWQEYNGQCYYISTSSDVAGTWSVAAATCQTKAGFHHQATLASIHHEAENKYIYNRLKENGRQQAWIGLKKDAYGRFDNIISQT
jgi:Lectin C-type domain